MWRCGHVETHMNASIDVHMSMRYVYAYVHMHMTKYGFKYSHKSIWVDTCNVNGHIYIYINTCVLGAFVDISTTNVSICIHIWKVSCFGTYVCGFVLMFMYMWICTHMCTCTFFNMYDLKWSKQSIDFCFNNIVIPYAIFILIILATEPLFCITHTLIFHFILAES